MTRLINLHFNWLEQEDHTGYGNVARQLIKELDKTVDIIHLSNNVLNFCMPKDYVYKKYTVGYTPWESTLLPKGWTTKMKRCDDLWAPNEFCAGIYREKLGRDIFVLPHAIESQEWIPIRRFYDEDDGPFTFLHWGAPAVRKGSDIILRVWDRHFKNNKNVRLLVKCTSHIESTEDKLGNTINPYNLENINIISGIYTKPELWRVLALSHCLVYPSRGEGFGMIPFEALATGLPTILPDLLGFSDYGLPLIKTRWVRSPYQTIHPGDWLDFDEDEIIHLMEHTIKSFKAESYRAFHNSYQLHHKFTWDQIANMAIERIESRI